MGTEPKRISHQVARFKDGTYRVVTTLERHLTEDEMVELNIPVSDLPWGEENKRVISQAERQSILEHWRLQLGGWDPRVPGRITVFLREFGERVVRAAIDEAATSTHQGGAGAKYAAVIRALRRAKEGDK